MDHQLINMLLPVTELDVLYKAGLGGIMLMVLADSSALQLGEYHFMHLHYALYKFPI